MKRPVLVIMAAGAGSRYGGPKQMKPVDEQGNLLMDYAVYDALAAGFREVIFILKRDQEARFRESAGKCLSRFIKVSYVAQELQDLPEGFEVPEGRVKPWGTGHAVLSCIYILNAAPFVVINGDAYYGKKAFKLAYNYLLNTVDEEDKYHYAMIQHSGEAESQASVRRLPGDGRLWAFTDSVLDELQDRFPAFLEQAKKNPLEEEYMLSSVVNELLQEQKADVKVLDTDDRWYGITCKEDCQIVKEAIRGMKEKGLYPKNLWRENKHIRTL